MFASVLLALLSPPSSFADRIGNGGGGIFNEETGEYKTFHNAGLYVEPAYLTDEQLPEVVKLRAELKALGLSPAIFNRIQQWLIPSHQRTFFKVAASKFSREEYEKIKDEYRKVFRDDRINIAIYAITDTAEKSTFLLPEFYKLKPEERLLITFHETMWMMAPEASYKDIVRVDDYMSRYLRERSAGAKFQLVAALDRLLSGSDSRGGLWDDGASNSFTPMSLLGFGYGEDLKTGALKGLVGASGQISLGQLIGAEGIRCYLEHSDPSSDAMDSATGLCTPALKNHWLELSARFPKSQFLKALLGGNPIVAIFNMVGSGNLIRGLALNANTSLVLSQKDLYNGAIMLDSMVPVWKQECSKGLFGRSCENKKIYTRTKLPLISFSDRVYVKELSPARWSTLSNR